MGWRMRDAKRLTSALLLDARLASASSPDEKGALVLLSAEAGGGYDARRGRTPLPLPPAEEEEGKAGSPHRDGVQREGVEPGSGGGRLRAGMQVGWRGAMMRLSLGRGRQRGGRDLGQRLGVRSSRPWRVRERCGTGYRAGSGRARVLEARKDVVQDVWRWRARRVSAQRR